MDFAYLVISFLGAMGMALVEFCCDPNGGDFVYRVNVVEEMLLGFSFLQPLDNVLAITWPSHIVIELFKLLDKIDLKEKLSY